MKITDTIELPDCPDERELQRVPSGFGHMDIWLGELDCALSRIQVLDQILSVDERRKE